MLREGGNAVDAAVCAVLTSFAVESPLTGLGAGGFMLVHTAARTCCSTSSSRCRGERGIGAERSWCRSRWSSTRPHSCSISAPPRAGCPGRRLDSRQRSAALDRCRCATWSGPPSRHARNGVAISAEQAYLFKILDPILTEFPRVRGSSTRRRVGSSARERRFDFPTSPMPWSGTPPRARSRSTAARSRGRSRRGSASEAERSAPRTLPRTSRSPASPCAPRFEAESAHQPAPLVRWGPDRALPGAARAAREVGIERVVATMAEANRARTAEFHAGLYEDGFAERFLAPARLDALAERIASG